MNLLPDEIVYEILLDKEVNDIDEFCYTNKKNTRICESLQFWQDKLLHDGLPPFLIDDVRNINNYSKELGIDRNVDTFIELYNQMEACYYQAKVIVFINKVELFNKITNGSIIITNPHYNDIKLYSYLPKSNIKWIESLKIKFKNNQYILYMNDLKINITESEAIKILTYLAIDNATSMIFDTFDENDPQKLRIIDSRLISFLKFRKPDIYLNKHEIVKKSIYQTYRYIYL